MSSVDNNDWRWMHSMKGHRHIWKCKRSWRWRPSRDCLAKTWHWFRLFSLCCVHHRHSVVVWPSSSYQRGIKLALMMGTSIHCRPQLYSFPLCLQVNLTRGRAMLNLPSPVLSKESSFARFHIDNRPQKHKHRTLLASNGVSVAVTHSCTFFCGVA